MATNGAQDRNEVLMKANKLSFGGFRGRHHLFDVFSSQLVPKRNGLSSDGSDSAILGKIEGSQFPS